MRGDHVRNSWESVLGWRLAETTSFVKMGPTVGRFGEVRRCLGTPPGKGPMAVTTGMGVGRGVIELG